MTVQHETTTSPRLGSTSTEGSRGGQVATLAGEEAGKVADTATESVREVADEVRAQASAVAGQAKEQLEGLVGQAREEIGQQAQQRSEQAAGQLRTLSEQLVALAEGRPENAGSLSGLLYDAEDRVRSLASRLEERGPQGVTEDLSNFARRRPGLFLAAAVGVGFVIGRAARAGSSAQQAGDGAQSPPSAGTTATTSFGREPLAPAGDGQAALSSEMRQ